MAPPSIPDSATRRREPVGLIAGNGHFPLLFARAAQKKHVPVVAVGMIGETRGELADLVDAVTWVHPGQLGRMIRAFRKAGIREAAMAGGVRKTRLFGRMRPDWRAMLLLARCVYRRDDGLLRALARSFEDAGIRIVESTRFMPEALAPAGVMTDARPNRQQWRDLRYGYDIARRIGALDIGQTVIVKAGTVVALEAIEGTDACIRRAGALTDNRGAVMVKVAKPAQDMRFDVPAIGVTTIERLAEAGIRVLGIEARRTLMLQPERIVQAARELGVVLVGLEAEVTA